MAAAGKYGRLRIGIHALIPDSFLAGLVAQYRAEHPGSEVEVTEGTGCDAVMQLREDRLNGAFVIGKLELPGCHTRPKRTEPLVAVLPDGHAWPDNRQPLGPIWSARPSLFVMAAPACRCRTITFCASQGAGLRRRSCAST
ncbi:LysR substrate-binding domain-containing protein [Rhodovulum sulfidophilum]|nr:LysR substrate-binding domain-containing protein [Rhodovulum sulfidophilum]